MSVDSWKIREEDNHVIDSDDFSDDDGFMGDSDQLRAIFEADLDDDLPEAGDWPDEGRLAGQCQAMEISSEHDSDKEIIPHKPAIRFEIPDQCLFLR